MLLDKSSASVRAMFEDIAPTYDLLNHLLSARQDVGWRRRAVRRLAPRPHERILDLCCGTGDSTLELSRQSRGAQVVGADFAVPMLERARVKDLPALVAADALKMPFVDEAFDAALVAFGARNFEDTRLGMREMARVVKPGGRLLVLEFMRPNSMLVKRGFAAFNLAFSPLGRVISGHPSAYGYLPESVNGFYSRREFEALLRETGWENVRSFDHSLGVASSFLARRRRTPQ